MTKDVTFEQYMRSAMARERIKGAPPPGLGGGESPAMGEPDQYIVPNTTPPGIYSDARHTELEQLLDFILGEKLAQQIRTIAGNRNARPVMLLRQTLWEGFRTGMFDLEAEDVAEKRTGNDDNPQHPDNQRLTAVISPENMALLQAFSRVIKRNPIATLRVGLQHALGDQTT